MAPSTRESSKTTSITESAMKSTSQNSTFTTDNTSTDPNMDKVIYQFLGKVIMDNGSSYQGQFIDDKIQGYDGCTYEGEFYNGIKHGQGKFTYPDGRSYEGQFNMGIKDGHGVYNWNDGRCYEGGWHNDKQHGEGQFCDQTGQVRLGIWENGKRLKWIEKLD